MGAIYLVATGQVDAATGLPTYTRHEDAPASSPHEVLFTQAEAASEREPVLLGRWHHGEGNVCSGSMRLLRADFDTNPSEEFQRELLDWLCEVMNAELQNALRRRAGPASSRRSATIAWPQDKSAKRVEDMGEGYLRLVLDSDNDVVVAVWDGQRSASVEFCNPGACGGGRSPKTRAALINLMTAIEQDHAADGASRR